MIFCDDIVEMISQFLTPEESVYFKLGTYKFNFLKLDELPYLVSFIENEEYISPGNTEILIELGHYFLKYAEGNNPKPNPFPMTNRILKFRNCYSDRNENKKECYGLCTKENPCYYRGKSYEFPLINFHYKEHQKALKRKWFSDFDLIRLSLSIGLMTNHKGILENSLRLYWKVIPKPFMWKINYSAYGDSLKYYVNDILYKNREIKKILDGDFRVKYKNKIRAEHERRYANLVAMGFNGGYDFSEYDFSVDLAAYSDYKINTKIQDFIIKTYKEKCGQIRETRNHYSLNKVINNLWTGDMFLVMLLRLNHQNQVLNPEDYEIRYKTDIKSEGYFGFIKCKNKPSPIFSDSEKAIEYFMDIIMNYADNVKYVDYDAIGRNARRAINNGHTHSHQIDIEKYRKDISWKHFLSQLVWKPPQIYIFNNIPQYLHKYGYSVYKNPLSWGVNYFNCFPGCKNFVEKYLKENEVHFLKNGIYIKNKMNDKRFPYCQSNKDKNDELISYGKQILISFIETMNPQLKDWFS